VPDGVADLGYLDDGFVVRLSARAALEAGVGKLDGETSGRIEELAAGKAVIAQFLGEATFGRLDRYARDLKTGAARGRTVEDIVGEKQLYEAFEKEAERFAESYQPPVFAADENSLIKLKAYFEAKLPE
jgi:hypothetical protein